MSIEQTRSWTGSSPEVTRRLCATIVCFLGVFCVFGGFLLGRVSRNELKKSNDIVPYNLTVLADNLYKKALRVSPKIIHHNDAKKVTSRLLQMFNCSRTDCGNIEDLNLGTFIKNCISYEVQKLLKSVSNATVYLDSLS